MCRQIHEIDPTLDVVMPTARDDGLDVVVGLDAGALDYITKPFKPAVLLVGRCVERMAAWVGLVVNIHAPGSQRPLGLVAEGDGFR